MAFALQKMTISCEVLLFNKKVLKKAARAHSWLSKYQQNTYSKIKAEKYIQNFKVSSGLVIMSTHDISLKLTEMIETEKSTVSVGRKMGRRAAEYWLCECTMHYFQWHEVHIQSCRFWACCVYDVRKTHMSHLIAQRSSKKFSRSYWSFKNPSELLNDANLDLHFETCNRPV